MRLRVSQQKRIDEPVVEHFICKFKALNTAHGDQARITRSAANKIDFSDCHELAFGSDDCLREAFPHAA